MTDDERTIWLKDQLRSDLARVAAVLNKYISVTPDGVKMKEACGLRREAETMLTDIEKYL